MPSHRPGFAQTAGLALLLLGGAAAAEVPVVTVQPEATTIAERITRTGSVTTPDDATLSPAVAGLVERVHVDAGDRVSAGDPIVSLDATLANLALRRTTAGVSEGRTQLAEAIRRLDEGRPLAQRGTLSQSEFATRKAAVEQARAVLQRLEAERAEQAERVARHVVRAPFDGVVRRRLTAPGEWVAGGDALVELVGRSALRVDVRIPQQQADRVTPGAAASVRLDTRPGDELPARVSAIVPAADPATRTVLTRITLDDPPPTMLPGSSAQVDIELPGADDAVAIPRDALMRFPDGTRAVWVVDSDDTARRRPVNVGTERGARVVVTEGLATTDRVVVRGNESLREGDRVTVRNQTPR